MGRIAWMAVGFCSVLALAGSVAIATAWDPALEAGGDLYRHRRVLERLTPREHPDDPLLVWLGDSTMMNHQGIQGYPSQIASRLGVAVETRDLYYPALDPYHHYLLMGPIADEEPDVVVIALHLRLFQPRTRFARRDLASVLPTPEIAHAATLPLHERGITLPAFLLYRALRLERVEEIFYVAQGLRQRFHDALAWEALGTPLRVKRPGANLEFVERYDEDLYRGHPMLAMVGATVELAARSGARVLAVVSPVPIAVLRRHGLYDEARYRERIDAITAVVRENGGELLDLHALIPRRGFSDALGHLDREGTARMVEALLPGVEARVEAARVARARGAAG